MPKSKVKKLHRRLVKKSHETKWLNRGFKVLLQALEIYANPTNWHYTGRERDIMSRGVVVGVEQVFEWNGPGKGPDVAATLLKQTRGESK